MPSRVDDRIQSRNLERLQKDIQKKEIDKGKQRMFEQVMGAKKQAEQTTQTSRPKVLEEVPERKEATLKSAEENQLKSSMSKKEPMEKTPVKRELREETVSKKTQETDEKHDAKQDAVQDSHREAKAQDLAYERAVTQKRDGDTSDSGQNGSSSEDAFFQTGVNFASGPTAPVPTAQTTMAGRIPDEILNQMVDQIYIGVNESGQKEFLIELQGSFFGGGNIRVSARAGKVNIHFSGLSKDAKKLVEDARGEMGERLKGKNLALGVFDVSE